MCVVAYGFVLLHTKNLGEISIRNNPQWGAIFRRFATRRQHNDTDEGGIWQDIAYHHLHQCTDVVRDPINCTNYARPME